MIIAGIYSFNRGQEVISRRYGKLLAEVKEVITAVDASKCKVKHSKEKTMPGKVLFSPVSLNKAFKAEFFRLSWRNIRVKCDYSTAYYTRTYKATSMRPGAFREMDFVKGKLGVEIQFGKYAFMVYNVCAKMTIFNKLGYIDAGVEVVPVKHFADEMSTGVSYFEQFVWDLFHIAFKMTHNVKCSHGGVPWQEQPVFLVRK